MTNEEHVMHLFERANPVPEPSDIVAPTRTSGDLIDLQHRSSTMTLKVIEPDAPEDHHTRRTWIVAVAAAVLLLVVGLVVAASTQRRRHQARAGRPARADRRARRRGHPARRDLARRHRACCRSGNG